MDSMWERKLELYVEVFEKYAAEYDGIIHINIGSGFSTCYQSACLLQPFELRDTKSRSLERIRAGSELVEQHQASFARIPEYLNDVLHVG